MTTYREQYPHVTTERAIALFKEADMPDTFPREVVESTAADPIARRFEQVKAERDELQRRISHVVREQAANPSFTLRDAVSILLGGNRV